MGHYDDCYEATRLSDERRRKDNLLKWIPDLLEEMDAHELEVMYEVAQNVDDYHSFIVVVGRMAASKRI